MTNPHRLPHVLDSQYQGIKVGIKVGYWYQGRYQGWYETKVPGPTASSLLALHKHHMALILQLGC